MTTPAYISITGIQHRLSTGTTDAVVSTYPHNPQDQFMAQGFSHDGCIPRDTQSCPRTGLRTHKAAEVIEFDDVIIFDFQDYVHRWRIPADSPLIHPETVEFSRRNLSRFQKMSRTGGSAGGRPGLTSQT